MGLFNKKHDAGNMHNTGGLRGLYEAAKPALNLSAEQETSIEHVLNELREERKDFKSHGDGNKEEMQTARQQAREKIKAVLNPAQQKIWRENVQKWREKTD